jgi:hypothetical protein
MPITTADLEQLSSLEQSEQQQRQSEKERQRIELLFGTIKIKLTALSNHTTKITCLRVKQAGRAEDIRNVEIVSILILWYKFIYMCVKNAR